MFFVKYYRFLTAYSVLLCLSACVSTAPQTEFNRSEAVKARIHLALAYLEQRDFAKAKENIDKALSHDHQDYLPHSVLAYYYQQIQDIEQAHHSYQTALTLSHHQPDVLNNYGTFLCEQGQFEQANRLFEQALSTQLPYYHQVDTLENRARCAQRANQPQWLEQSMQPLWRLDPIRAADLTLP